MAGLSGLSGLSGEPGIFGGAATYIDKVRGYGPIAYWVLNEEAGATAVDQINSPAQDGAYTGVSLANALGPDGVNSAPLFDGTNDYVNIYTATLNSAFDGQEGSAMIWAKVFNVGVWTDATTRFCLNLYVDGDNQGFMRRLPNNNRLQWYYEANNTAESIQRLGLSETGWMCLGLTWSLSAGADGQVLAYYNGSQEGATQTALGTWAGNLFNTRTAIGAFQTTPSDVWYGWLAHCAIWDSALSPAIMADLASATP